MSRVPAALAPPARYRLLIAFAVFTSGMAFGFPRRDDYWQMVEELERVEQETRMLEEALQSGNLEITKLRESTAELDGRLAALGDAADGPAIEEVALPSGSEDENATPLPVIPPEISRKQAELATAVADRIVYLESGEKRLGTAFAVRHNGGVRFFTAAGLVSGHEKISIVTADGTAVAIAGELTCPDGVGVLAIHPESADFPTLEIAPTEALPGVGEQVLVVGLDEETGQPLIAGGLVRGVGPDVVELDAALPPETTGLPVFSLESGQVIGFVAPQIEGVSTEWARGTRHTEARVFVARLDRVKDGRTIPLSRFVNEAAYIERFTEESRRTWLAFMLLEYGRGDLPQEIKNMRDYRRARNAKERHTERMREIREEAQEHKAHPFISRAIRWADGGLEDRAFILRQMADDLEKQRDLSSEFTWYHGRVYQNAAAMRNNGILEIRASANRLGQ